MERYLLRDIDAAFRRGERLMSVQAKLDHLGLYTKDIERSMRWYHEILGYRLSDYLPPGNIEEPVAPDGISWMRYSRLHHDMTFI